MKRKIKKMIDDTRIQYTFKGILVGTFAGLVVSLFRLAIEHLLQYIISIYELFREKPHLIPFWILVSLITALFLGYLIKEEPNIKGSGIPQVEGQLHGEIQVLWWPVL